MSAVDRVAGRWLRESPRSGALPVVCFPHGGAGSSAYEQWSIRAPSSLELVPVRPPGRAHRFREAPISDLEQLAAAAIDGLTPWLRGQYALLGHCIGGYVAFEVARQLERARRHAPVAVIVSGCAAPHVAYDRLIHDLPDADFLEGVKELGGLSAEVIADPAFAASVLPALRADCTAAETYEPDLTPIDTPIVVLGGSRDPLVSRERLAAWALYSRRPLRLHMYPTGHFYEPSVLTTALTVVADELLALAARGTDRDDPLE